MLRDLLMHNIRSEIDACGQNRTVTKKIWQVQNEPNMKEAGQDVAVSAS